VVLALWALAVWLRSRNPLLCELAAMWPDVGGEYVYLKRIFGPLPPSSPVLVSLIVGFSAPWRQAPFCWCSISIASCTCAN
jgi:hypothetical protein